MGKTAGVRTVATGAGFAGDRIEPAVALAASGYVDAVILECLAERTIVPGLRALRDNPEAGADPRLKRRLSPLLPVARKNNCRVITNLGAANAAAAGRAIAKLAGDLGCSGMRVAAVVGDDVLALKDRIEWEEPITGNFLGARAYLGIAALAEAIEGGADVVVTGRAADSSLFVADLVPHLESGIDVLAGAIAAGHVLECSAQVTGGIYEPPGGGGLDAMSYAHLGYPLARVAADGSAEISILEDAPGLVDRMTCTLQLLYEVHDPSKYITPDAVLDFTGITFEEVGKNRVRMSGATAGPPPRKLKVSGFVEYEGAIADLEIAYAGNGAYERAQIGADILRERLKDWDEKDIQIDLVGVNSVLGSASPPTNAYPAEVRVHVSARCADMDAAQIVEDEIYGLTIAGPAVGCGVRSERRPRLDVISGFVPRELVKTHVEWSEAP